jgi:hypothetical protein
MKILRAILNFFCEIFLRCSHSRLTWIFTIEQETYRVCLDCGTHVPYSAVTFRPLTAREIRRLKAAHTGTLKIMPASISATAALQTVERKSSAA